ncbi:hypothetical protein THIOM_005280 [Candidatus Thiomargarita nelsonii]|uniref:Uncharacterized protein n=1 Tax=Candidatus Thiomargarita nelsonii TaxID=1003181 RepID=A0A176RTP1_9GAMM|nr:hypothetical protein THIOM_005280 [Candidatus Thiomargarita nelsonii]
MNCQEKFCQNGSLLLIVSNHFVSMIGFEATGRIFGIVVMLPTQLPVFLKVLKYRFWLP